MSLTDGREDVVVALLDGPVAVGHPDLANARLRSIGSGAPVDCLQGVSRSCQHGTFVAGVLAARRGSDAPAVCPGCTLLVRPIFSETTGLDLPAATPGDLAGALLECETAGAQVLNISAAITTPSTRADRELTAALDRIASAGAITVAAAGNQGSLGGSAITRHPGVIAVVAYGRDGLPMSESNLGRSIGRRGLGAPGEGITSLGADGAAVTSGGTSVAAALVSGAIALLWSLFPSATASEIKAALIQATRQRRTSIIPPMLDAWATYQSLSARVDVAKPRSGPKGARGWKTWMHS